MTTSPFQHIGRAVAIVLFVGIMVMTPCAFWTFAVNRVMINPQTYKTALSSGHVYSNLLPALAETIAFDTKNNNNPAVKNTLKALSTNMTEADWAEVSSKLLPPAWLQDEVDQNIDRAFDWLSGLRQLPDLQLDLTPLKDKLASKDARNGVSILVSKMPTCTAKQVDAINSADLSTPDGMNNFPLCNPQDSTTQGVAVDKLTAALGLISQQMPAHIDLNEELHKDPNNTALAIQAQADQIRAGITLISRLMILLFLIPMALLALIVILTVRSAKSFFRWLGWGLIISGLISIIPIPFISAPLGALTTAGAGAPTNLLQTLLTAMVSTINSMLITSAVIEIGIALLIGFFALVVSILVASPPPVEAAPQTMAIPSVPQS